MKITDADLAESRRRAEDFIRKHTEECAHRRASMIESLAIEYLKKTGLQADQVEIVERQDGQKIVWYFRKKGSDE